MMLTLGRLIRMLWPPVLLAAVLIGGWQLLSDYSIKNPEVLPSPS